MPPSRLTAGLMVIRHHPAIGLKTRERSHAHVPRYSVDMAGAIFALRARMADSLGRL
jgi:hypothetical protein